jgi:hypothetical protein
LGHDAGVGDHGHAGELMSVLLGVDHRQHDGDRGVVALESLRHQREPGRAGKQTEGVLRIQTAFL